MKKTFPFSRVVTFRQALPLQLCLGAFVVLLSSFSPLRAQDLLRQRFVEKVKSIVSSSDAVVGVAMKDLTTGEELFINEDEIFPQASSIKIHILAELYRQAEEGKFKLTDITPLPESVRVGGSGVLGELGKNSVSMSLRDYAVLMMVLSDNTATNLLIEKVGMENVNRLLTSNGATKTKLQRVMMDVQAAKEGRENIGTPREVLRVLERLYRGELVSRKASEDMLAILKKPKGGALRAGIPDQVELANKEGEVEGIRCDVGIVFLPGSPYGLCVMTKMLPEPGEGRRVISEISRTAYGYFERKANSNQYGRRVPR
jgi:beta-lactamase class A